MSVEEMYVSVGTSIARPHGRRTVFLSMVFDNGILRMGTRVSNDHPYGSSHLLRIWMIPQSNIRYVINSVPYNRRCILFAGINIWTYVSDILFSRPSFLRKKDWQITPFYGMIPNCGRLRPHRGVLPSKCVKRIDFIGTFRVFWPSLL